MKTFLLIASFIVLPQLYASESEVFNINLPDVNSYRTEVDPDFFMDQRTNQGYVDIYVFEDQSYELPKPVVIVFSQRYPVKALKLKGKQVVYQTENEEIDCGYMGLTRVFKRPKLFLSGNCYFETTVAGDHRDTEITVELKTR